mmetsp:Transcript_16270/g.19021  ORF Transcript_16270/g.19021 Transcript_16270/m.19021 type:complete len:138 (-) Transcript_16270:586-999(-)
MSTMPRLKFKTAYEVFMDFVVYLPSGEVKTEKMLSKECYNAWLKSRRSQPKKPQKSFRKALLEHVCAKNSRKQFPKEVERSLLKHLRQRKTWHCFKGEASIGCYGFKGFGYHELQDMVDIDHIFFETLAQFVEDKGI